MQFGIRSATVADAPALAELAALTFPLACPPDSPASEVATFISEHLGVEAFASSIADPHRVLFVAQEQHQEQREPAFSQGRLLAYTMLVDAPPTAADVVAVLSDADAIEFSKCYAHPDTHGTGVAASIMTASLEWIDGQGRSVTWLGVNGENERAQKFYRKHGFAVIGTRSFQLGTKTEHDYVMVRSKGKKVTGTLAMAEVKVEQLRIPEDLQDSTAADFLEAVEVSRQVRVDTWGNDFLAYTPAELFALCHDPYEWYVVLVARQEGKILGRAGIAMPLDDNTELAHVTLDVLPAAAGHGVGRKLLEAAELFVKGENRKVVVVETNHPAADLESVDMAGERLAAAHGSLGLPVKSREARFASNAGYALERVEQFSACTLPLGEDLLEQLTARAEATHQGAYRVHQWMDACPEEWAADFVRLEKSHNEDTDDGDPGTWDVEQLREAEELSRLSGRRTVVSAAQCLDSGALVGFTSISLLGHRADVAFQDETMVQTPHQGKDVGLHIKVTNMKQLQQHFPELHAIYSWNAPENETMLAVDATLGYVNAGVTGQWRKDFNNAD
ncbi:GNAT family N-acetyltransferase [Arthrobacter sp. Sr24]